MLHHAVISAEQDPVHVGISQLNPFLPPRPSFVLTETKRIPEI